MLVCSLFREIFTSLIITSYRCLLNPFYTNFGRASGCFYGYLYLGYVFYVEYYSLCFGQWRVGDGDHDGWRFSSCCYQKWQCCVQCHVQSFSSKYNIFKSNMCYFFNAKSWNKESYQIATFSPHCSCLVSLKHLPVKKTRTNMNIFYLSSSWQYDNMTGLDWHELSLYLFYKKRQPM